MTFKEEELSVVLEVVGGGKQQGAPPGMGFRGSCAQEERPEKQRQTAKDKEPAPLKPSRQKC